MPKPPTNPLDVSLQHAGDILTYLGKTDEGRAIHTLARLACRLHLETPDAMDRFFQLHLNDPFTDEPFVHHIPSVSTAHMPGPDPWPGLHDDFCVEETHYGFLAYVGGEETPDNTPAWLLPIIAWARQNQFEWIWFDRDASTVPGLPTFDWDAAQAAEV